MKLSSLSVCIAFSISAGVYAEPDNNRYIIQVDNANKGVVKALAKRFGGDIKLDSDGFFAASFTGKDLQTLRGLLNNPHIKLIEQDHPRTAFNLFNDDIGDAMTQQLTPYAVYQAQADKVLFDGNSGIKVCVIDSGLDQSNSDFVWGNIDGTNDSGTGNWYEQGGPHGTHVAGTIGAADNNVGVIGMAPGVLMHIVKVFNASGWGYSSSLAHAANVCAAAGANIINMSLGGGGASSTESAAFENFASAGGLSIAAAGNDGNSVRSYPAGYSSVMMVGANDANNQIASFSQFPSCETGRGKKRKQDETICVEVTAGGVDTLSTYPAGTASNSAVLADGIGIASSAMENTGDESASPYFMGLGDTVDSGANGKVCVIDRGSISFHDKALNCQNSGGIAAVIVNNEAGLFSGTLGSPNNTSIPTVGVALEDRSQMLNALSIRVKVGASDYGYMSGTSMATPAVAGVAALVWSNHSDCSGEEIRSVLKATALDGGAAGKDVYFGYGIVQAKAADDYLIANPCGGDGGGDPGTTDLKITGYKVRGVQHVDLVWSGLMGSLVDIYRNGSVVDSVNNNGEYTDNIGVKGGGSYTYKVCESGSTQCTSEQSIVF
ncbi:S8 family serine peptidase [Pseudoalteromonas piratica]|uniref:Alkaline serine protease n=1 Tax=Pseudoalteromonas piratica TaxID=1348114 RepID=A0A0A7ECT4_9GAMM|nr:S8 family serine peptidase [Pseudoalteromonas piratica]AIY63847.1 alkaline serine protease [Pseudoalteromonas piratica]